MSADRFVVLGLAQVRAAWFADVSRWSMSGAIPVDFEKCVSIEEVRGRLAAGRAVSALLLDAQRTGLDRDLLDAARSAGAATIIVGDELRDWVSLGAAAQLPATFTRHELAELIERCAFPIARTDLRVDQHTEVVDGGWRGTLIAVTGTGGAGASTVAMSVAQACATNAQNLGLVLLADLALNADLAMYHDARDVIPGLQEAVEAHRNGTLDPEHVRALTYTITDRGYQLLLGLRNHRDWTAVRPRAFDAALDSMRRAFRIVVADVDADVEGQDRTGSIDVEERNTIARITLRRADLVLVVGSPGVYGLHALVRTIHRLIEHGIDPARLCPVFNRCTRSPRQRAEIVRAFAALTAQGAADSVTPPVFIGDRRGLDDLVTQAAPMPRSLTKAIGQATAILLDDAAHTTRPMAAIEPERIAPGSLGSWNDFDDEAEVG